ncbi:MAG: hypothetical protein A3I11_04585 [Elusimicrobia bacterium RIFCSPLOWO2_02_FULL_39_32]|nr:MAG: hypothetical protein A3B80_03155 [Elusimicrobia bacterium RIFCSPHIGHO2_02_FULL_39_36]OGR92968.1 MAG: hypothetical protein A3I11_04585 [Elusimicrobia bacterium RIFCSPLOWO2_02_FULL_39_32]OGR99751.1 MAG: hypothetical protein A3G85_01945 [Elusimicrobia bacterium RIFCSPLOWO2_12_FULL_39_28]
MITQIFGKVVEVSENSITLQVNEFAYELFVPGSVIDFYRKKFRGVQNNEESEVFYTIQYLEGSTGHGNQFVRLVGFKRKIEKDFFLAYTSVEGIGYKTALKSLILPIQKIALAIERNDCATLKKLPHIGSRTAEKMVATLKGRMKKFILDQEESPLSVKSEPDFHLEVLQVLKQVGYSEFEAQKLIDAVLGKNPQVNSSEEMIQEIFKMKNKISND